MIRRFWREVVAHFTDPRCVYCGTRQDRDDGMGCITPHMWCAFHVFPDGPGPMRAAAAPGSYDEDDD